MLEVAGKGASEAVATFGLALVRIWLLEPLETGTPVLASTAAAQYGIEYGGLLEAHVPALLATGSATLQARPDESVREGTIPGGAFLGIPLVIDGRMFGYLETYSEGALTFSDAAKIETWAQTLVQALDAANATAQLEAAPRGHVLVADDDASIRKLLETLLKRKGFDVTAVANGMLAYERARELQPDLVLLDWMMPIMDGRTAAAKLKQDEATRNIPVVMLTSQARTEDKVSALEAGAQDYLTKPFDARELVARIEQQLRWRKLLADSDEASPPKPAQHAEESSAYAAAPPADGDFWRAAVQAQQLGNFREALTHYVAEAERAELAKHFPRAAIAFRSASVAAGQLHNLDLSNKLLRLAGKMYLSWAESADDGNAIKDAYVNAARCFLSAGNLKLARKSVEIAESMHTVMADDAPSALP